MFLFEARCGDSVYRVIHPKTTGRRNLFITMRCDNEMSLGKLFIGNRVFVWSSESNLSIRAS